MTVKIHGNCTYCSIELNDVIDHPNQRTRDHINPRHRGGGKTVISCRWCNNLKSHMPFTTWERFLRFSHFNGQLNRPLLEAICKRWRSASDKAEHRRREIERLEREHALGNREPFNGIMAAAFERAGAALE